MEYEWFLKTYEYMAIGLAGLTIFINAYTIKKPDEYRGAVKVLMIVIAAMVLICWFAIALW